MIDRIALSPDVHQMVGGLVLLSTLLSALLTGWQAWRYHALGRKTHWLLIVTQLILMVQALVGIKLLDQGLGVLQLYIHYLGGLAPLFLLVLLYWLPQRSPRSQAWLTFGATVGAFVFALLTFTIGQYYVNNPPLS